MFKNYNNTRNKENKDVGGFILMAKYRQCSICGINKKWAPGTNSHAFSVDISVIDSQVCLDCLRKRARLGNNVSF
jgi:hypothetical protein